MEEVGMGQDGCFNSRLREEATGKSTRRFVRGWSFNSRLREEATMRFFRVLW